MRLSLRSGYPVTTPSDGGGAAAVTGWRTILYLQPGSYNAFQIVPGGSVVVAYPGGGSKSEGAADWPLFTASGAVTKRYRVVWSLDTDCEVNVRLHAVNGTVSRSQEIDLLAGSGEEDSVEIEQELTAGQGVGLHFDIPNGTPTILSFRVDEEI